MKKMLILLSSLFATCLVHAQGEVWFNNFNTLYTKISVNQTPGGAATSLMTGPAGAFDFAFYYTVTANTVLGSADPVIPRADGELGNYVVNDPNWKYVTTYGNAAQPGRLQVTSPDTIPDVPAGGYANFVVFGWSADLGSDPETALFNAQFGNFSDASVIGESAVAGTFQLGNDLNYFIPRVFGNIPPSIHGFTLGEIAFVPEPTSWALAATVALLWLVGRFRKSPPSLQKV